MKKQERDLFRELDEFPEFSIIQQEKACHCACCPHVRQFPTPPQRYQYRYYPYQYPNNPYRDPHIQPAFGTVLC